MINKQNIFETSINQLRKLAMVAGFTPQTGLYNGRMGIIIVLYSGANFFNLKDVEEIADHLLDDLLDEIQQNIYVDFTNGITGVGWGINYLIRNSLIEVDSDFFNDIDTFIFNQLSLDEFSIDEYLLTSLYLSSRYTNNPGNEKLKECINEYFIKITEVIDKANKKPFITNDSLLPFWFSLGKFEFEIVSHFDAIVRFISENNPQEKIKILFGQKYSNTEISNSKKISFKTVNQYFFDVLVYESTVPKLSMTLLDETFNTLIIDKKLIQSLDKTINPLNLGLSRSFSGYVWSTLQYCKMIT